MLTAAARIPAVVISGKGSQLNAAGSPMKSKMPPRIFRDPQRLVSAPIRRHDCSPPTTSILTFNCMTRAISRY
jgi:hypothetical protein